MNRKKICIIYTGGTIGMTPTENGFAPSSGQFHRELSLIHDLTSPQMPEWDLIEYNPLLDSSNVAYEQWNLMAHTIEENYVNYDGFVVLHGTDTMAYSASALSFMLEGLEKPVIFTGSQIPLCELRSDGKDNLITSMLIAASGMVNEVALYFSNTLLRGNRATKVSADDLIAFDSPNYPHLASVGIDIEYRPKHFLHSGDAEGFRIVPMNKYKIGVVKVFPGIQFELFEPMVEQALDGLILETFGTGNIPSNSSVPEIISKAVNKGTVVAVLTQCPQGTVRLGAYEAGADLLKNGAVSGFDMTTEAAVTKLTYLLSKGLDSKKAAEMMSQNIRGELSDDL